MDTLAFYGKKLIGYESVMNGTLKELNQLGKGQIIGKSHTFSRGIWSTWKYWTNKRNSYRCKNSQSRYKNR